jgi:hypothetical protein
LAEGDSWFRYDCGFGVIHYLAWELRGKATFVNLAGSGATLRSMLHMPGRQGFENCLRKGFQERHPWYAVLFSGGGNDICDKDFGAWLVPYRQGMSPRDAIDASTWEPKMREVMDLYALLAGLVGELAGETKVFVNLYDFATPNNVGVGPVGPWLAPGFKEKHYPADLDFRRAVVKILLEDFAARLRTVAASHPNLQIVPTQGILAEDEWANELHPTNPGFEKISRVFRAALGF